ncbi:MAG: hypothetical protein CMJ88_03715 [Planctomycetes bacterium]|nr:hypothetical protein [Planctomycetota bacterium]
MAKDIDVFFAAMQREYGNRAGVAISQLLSCLARSNRPIQLDHAHLPLEMPLLSVRDRRRENTMHGAD